MQTLLLGFNLQLDLRTQLVFGFSDTFGDEFKKKE